MLVRVSARFELARVRVIGIRLYNLLCVYLVVQQVSQKQIFIKEMASLVYVVCEPLHGVDLGHNSLFRGRYAQIGGRGKGRFFRFQLTQIMEKILRTSKKTQKKSPKNPIPGYAETISNPLIVLNTKESPCLNQSTKKKYLLKFYSQTFKPKTSFDHSCRLKSGVPLRAATYIIYQVSRGICSVNLKKKKTRLSNETEN